MQSAKWRCKWVVKVKDIPTRNIETKYMFLNPLTLCDIFPDIEIITFKVDNISSLEMVGGSCEARDGGAQFASLQLHGLYGELLS